MIETTELTKKFNSFTAVDSVTLTVPSGEVMALLGPNGAGKTTTIRMLASILKPTGGSAVVGGVNVEDQPEAVRSMVGLLTEHHGLYTRMRAYEYLDFFGKLYGLTSGEIRPRAEELLKHFDLIDATDLRLGQYSKGMRQKLALVRALLHDPKILLLDEPTSAMDPASAFNVRESIRSLRAEDRTIIVCTHNLYEAEELADKIAIIRRGTIIAHDRTRDLKKTLLGHPIMELRLGTTLDGAVDLLPPDLEILDAGDDWIRYQTEDPNETNPAILKALTESDIPIVTLSEIERSLEDLYLQVVGQNEGQAGMQE